MTTSRIATLLVLHAAGAGLASPAVLVTPAVIFPPGQAPDGWLPKDNQTIFVLSEGYVRRLELNTTNMMGVPVVITVSPCTRNLQWSIYHAKNNITPQALKLARDFKGADTETFEAIVSENDRYVLEMQSSRGDAAVAVSVRGEPSRAVRLRLRNRSKRRLSASWDPSPVDPQATTYCVVASQKSSYTSLCAARYDLKESRLRNPTLQVLPTTGSRFDNRVKDIRQQKEIKADESDNQIVSLVSKELVQDQYNTQFDVDYMEDLFTGDFGSYVKRKKFSRSTRVSDEDPMIVCVGGRTHHVIENLDPSKTYFVSVFGVGRDRCTGALMASGSVSPRVPSAKRLKDSIPTRAELRGKPVFYYKTPLNDMNKGIWLSISVCGGNADVEVLVRGKRLQFLRNIGSHTKQFVEAPLAIQEGSDESSGAVGSSSSEEGSVRYVIKIQQSRRARDQTASVELVASTNRWGAGVELSPRGGATLRELRPLRTCRELHIAFLPAQYLAQDLLRYCVSAYDVTDGGTDITCDRRDAGAARTHCFDHVRQPQLKVLTQKISGLQPARTYAIQVIATAKGLAVPYETLFAETSVCKKDID